MRLPFIPLTDLSPEQKPLYEDMKAGIAAKYHAFKTMRDDGTILGPWSAWLHEVDLGTAIWGVTKAMSRFRHLPENVRQIVILVELMTLITGIVVLFNRLSHRIGCAKATRRQGSKCALSPYIAGVSRRCVFLDFCTSQVGQPDA